MGASTNRGPYYFGTILGALVVLKTPIKWEALFWGSLHAGTHYFGAILGAPAFASTLHFKNKIDCCVAVSMIVIRLQLLSLGVPRRFCLQHCWRHWHPSRQASLRPSKKAHEQHIEGLRERAHNIPKDTTSTTHPALLR